MANPKRSLILAGGGMKVGFQAGVLQVWLDEADLQFDHVDGASGGVFNLAMMAQGMTGMEIANAWRRTNPIESVSPNTAELARLAWAKSLFTLDALKENLFATWQLDFARIRASKLEATFNSYNFTRHELAMWPPSVMTEEHLCACVALPMWFPPVVFGNETFIDSVYMTDGNLEEAIRRGADEIWVVWTVSERGVWEDGFVANYFQIIETAANGHFHHIVARIERNNAEIQAGRPGEFGRTISLRILRAEVPVHYLVALSKDRLTETVNMGVEHARKWCKAEGITLHRSTGTFPTDVHEAHTTLQFIETMKGFVAPGVPDYRSGYEQGKSGGNNLNFKVTIHIDGVNRFVVNPQHEASISGWVEGDAVGGRCQVEKGGFNLLVDLEDSTHKAMYYRIWFKDAHGDPRTLVGFKDVRHDAASDVWEDTTTLFVRLLAGHKTESEDGGSGVLASGIMKIELLDFLQQLTTFKVTGPTLADRTAAFSRFGRLFMGKLWDVYATGVLSQSPL